MLERIRFFLSTSFGTGDMLKHDFDEVLYYLDLPSNFSQAQLKNYLSQEYFSTNVLDTELLGADLKTGIITKNRLNHIFVIEGPPNEPVQYTDDINCIKAGTISYPRPLRCYDQLLTIITELEFGKTEIKVIVNFPEIEVRHETLINFL